MMDASQNTPGAVLHFGPLQWIPGERTLLHSGRPVQLYGRSGEILALLLERPGELVTVQQFFARVWPRTVVAKVTLRVHLAALRKTLQTVWPEVNCLESVTGHGYRFVAPVMRPPSVQPKGPGRIGD
jgi:DNA-binding winged helix-turn-helix (wHTH) protein